MDNRADPIRVFVSYSWDSQEHRQLVLELTQRLRGGGIDAWMDAFTPFPEEGWPRWMDREIEKAAFVVVVASQRYADRFAGQAAPGVGLGATWEGAIITQDLFESGANNNKYLPVILDDRDRANVPKPLRPFTHFRVNTPDGYDSLVRLITGRLAVTPAALGVAGKVVSGARPLTRRPQPVAEVHDHVSVQSNLPRLPYFLAARRNSP